MYMDIFDTLSVNKKLIRVLGITTAVYWAYLSEVIKGVLAQDKFDEHGFFSLDRDTITKEIGYPLDTQLGCESTLRNLGILDYKNDSFQEIAVNVQAMLVIVSEETIQDFDTLKESLAKKATRVKTKSEKAKAKEAGIKFNLKNAIIETDLELKEAYDSWIDAIIEAKNCRFTKAVVETFKRTVDLASDRKEDKLRIINIATIKAYKDASWAIRIFNQERGYGYNKSTLNSTNQSVAVDLGEQRVAKEVMTDIKF